MARGVMTFLAVGLFSMSALWLIPHTIDDAWKICLVVSSCFVAGLILSKRILIDDGTGPG